MIEEQIREKAQQAQEDLLSAVLELIKMNKLEKDEASDKKQKQNGFRLKNFL